MQIHELTKSNSLFSQFLKEIRDEAIQQDRLRFRKNIERMGAIMAYEISKTLEYDTTDTKTPLATAKDQVLKEQPIIASVLRAGLPLHQALLDYFDQADNAFAAAYRKEEGESVETVFSYLAAPSIENKVVILADPMLATGGSMLRTYEELLKRGNPKQVHLVSIIASEQGVQRIEAEIGDKVTLWVGKVDPDLTTESYISPGIGDAGDLAFGEKL